MSEIDVERVVKALTEVELTAITFSATTDKGYVVQIRQGTFFDCTCPDFINRGSWTGSACKHLLCLVTKIGSELADWDETCRIMKEIATVQEED